MKIKAILAVAIAAVTMASCAKDNGGDINNTPAEGTRNVLMQIETPKATRAIGDNADGEALAISSGHIIFANVNSGEILRFVEIRGANDASGNNQVNVSDLTTTGATIPEVPTNSDICYVFANHGLTGLTSSLTNVSQIKALTFAVENMYDANDKGVAKVPIFGSGEVKEGTATINSVQQAVMETTVKVNAIGSRIQIKGMKLADQTAKNSVITSFKVKSIFVNNYYPTMKAMNLFTGISIVNNGSTKGKYIPTDAAFAYTGFTESLYNYAAAGIGVAMTGAEGTGYWADATKAKYWAYNVFPNLLSAGLAKEQLPHIVIEIEAQVEHNNAAAVTETRYLTVKGYTDDVTTNAIENFALGNSYTLGGDTGFEFDYDDTKDVPEQGTLNGIVKVTPISWKDNSVTPEF